MKEKLMNVGIVYHQIGLKLIMIAMNTTKKERSERWAITTIRRKQNP